MTAISPVIGEEWKDVEVTFARNQKEYLPLPVIQHNGILLSRWKPTDSERAMIAAGADLHFMIWTGGAPLQPVRIEVMEHDRCLLDTAKMFGLVPQATEED